MKVIQILPELNSGGVERGTLEIARALVGSGNESVVVSNGGRLVDQLEREGSRHITLPVHRKSLISLKQVSVLRRLFVVEKPDIIHVRSRVPAWLGWLAWRKMDPLARPRLVTTVHGFYSVNAYSRIMTRGERVIAVSESVERYVKKNYPQVPSDRVRVIHRGVDPGEFPCGYQPPKEWLRQWRAEHPKLEGAYLVLLPARITRWKGQEDLVSIIDGLVKSGVPVHGLLAGGPHPRKRRFFQELKDRVAAMNLEGHIHFLGHRNDLREIMAVSNIVMSLSTDPEAFGRVTLEALSLGIPVIGYNHGGVAEQLARILPDGAVPVGDKQAVAELIRKWHTRPPILRSENPFTLEAMQSRTLETYRELLHPPESSKSPKRRGDLPEQR